MSNFEAFLASGYSSHVALAKKAVKLLGGEEAWEELYEDAAARIGINPLVSSKWTKKAKIEFYDTGVVGLINIITSPKVSPYVPSYSFKVVSLNTDGMSLQRIIDISRYSSKPTNNEKQFMAEFGLFAIAAEYEEWCHAECMA